MTNLKLQSPNESIPQLAAVIERGNGKARLEVREDCCFRDKTWLLVGDITAHPGDGELQDSENALHQALRLGSYGWTIPKFDGIKQEALNAFPAKARIGNQLNSHNDKTRRALEAIVHCAARCGFVNPTFDAGNVAEMPFSRPTTIVVDTSAILQGGLDFVIRFLYPMARIKTPAIAHMEILNMAERYFTHRRLTHSDIRPATALLDHVTGQGGQRVLLRLELQTEAEIERPRLGADPLRGIVQPDTDSEDKALGLQQIQRSFADRLILETAIQHRDRLSPDHPIMVLTADQGLARMTLAEGLQTLFFTSPPIDDVCGRTHPATCFRPFIDEGSEAPFFHISLPTLIWELACTFGSARLIAADQSTYVTISAIGEGLSWHPFHSRDDLLWTESAKPESSVQPSEQTHPSVDPEIPSAPEAQPTDRTISDRTEGAERARRSTRNALKGSYRFSVPAMLQLILAFERKDRLSDRDGMRIVGLTTSKRYADLRNFLLAGNFVERTADDVLAKTHRLDELIQTLRIPDLECLKQLLLKIASFSGFLAELSVGRSTQPEKLSSISQSAVKTYTTLAEISCSALNIAGEGVYLTPHSPPPSEFAKLVWEAYRRLKGGEEYVLTGRWLEEMARRHGVHPIRSRERLNEAREAGYLERYTEGSTPETQYERHKMAVLELVKGVPSVRDINLYHGDFLIPGKASVSIRFAELKK